MKVDVPKLQNDIRKYCKDYDISLMDVTTLVILRSFYNNDYLIDKNISAEEYFNYMKDRFGGFFTTAHFLSTIMHEQLSDEDKMKAEEIIKNLTKEYDDTTKHA